MLVDEIGDVTITNDGATILALLDIEHPAAKVLVELAQLQDQEVMKCSLHFTRLIFSFKFCRWVMERQALSLLQQNY